MELEMPSENGISIKISTTCIMRDNYRVVQGRKVDRETMDYGFVVKDLYIHQ